jgi:hypothetical protein
MRSVGGPIHTPTKKAICFGSVCVWLLHYTDMRRCGLGTNHHLLNMNELNPRQLLPKRPGPSSRGGPYSLSVPSPYSQLPTTGICPAGRTGAYVKQMCLHSDLGTLEANHLSAPKTKRMGEPPPATFRHSTTETSKSPLSHMHIVIIILFSKTRCFC